MGFEAGEKVRLIGNPAKVGVATGKRLELERGVLIEVELEGGLVEHLLELALERAPERIDLEGDFAAGRFSGPADLSAVITLEKLRGELTDLIYSMGAGRTDFYPHQFKPVLRFVQANVGRILIADEVGLGKTIEAIYLWKELQVRDQARRLLIVCPSMLREKWRRELVNAFGIEARIVNAAELSERLRQAETNSAFGFALIAGLEGCRPPPDFETAEGSRAELARILNGYSGGDDEGLIDLTVIDEAHYLRNPETQSHRLGELLRDASRRMALLTATPIQIRSNNLFQLLNLVDPEEYPTEYEFELRREANAPIVAAAAAFRRSGLDPAEAASKIDECLHSPLFKGDDWLRALRDRLSDGPIDRESQIAAARELEARSLLGRHMTRSRKRDVLPNRVERSAQPLHVRFTTAERTAHDSILKALRARAANQMTGTALGFAMVMRQRQMASSLPAAIASWRESGFVDEQLWEDLGRADNELDLTDLFDAGPEPPPDIDLAELEASDSKYACFVHALRKELANSATPKIVVFAYFRKTLEYLHRRLAADDVNACLLMGGMPDQQEILDAFQAPDGPCVLLSSEVASEGVDLQFARMLVNYDLPWNPMRVEQRIGRLDRLGQKAEKIAIINLFVGNTIEERILERLYDRIEIFRHSVGELETILGDVSEELLASVMNPNLSDEEREKRADDTLNALQERILANRELEEEAQHLLGLNDLLAKEVDAAKEAGEWIRPDELRRFIIDTFGRVFPASRLVVEPADEDFFRLVLCPAAQVSLLAYLDREDPAGRARGCARPQTLFLSDAKKIGSRRAAVEVIDAGHMIIRWLRSVIDIDGMKPHAVCAARSHATECGLAPGTYTFALHARRLAGLSREAVLEACAFRLEDSDPQPLTGPAGAAVRRAAEMGARYRPPPAAIANASALAVRAGVVLAERAYSRYEAFQAENDRVCGQREASARSFRDRKVADIDRTIATVSGDPRRERIVPLKKRERQIQDQQLALKLERIKYARNVSFSDRPVAMGLLQVE